ncbi:carboxylesterase 3 [Dermacentor silvarum]|uniref:carboxylesterase 3 n=1 Tax=Dermacentor silvarum TaxID=543639 RepID=UPI002101054D|nr:carboxylesterase 3 [Dermacentor silvarum]
MLSPSALSLQNVSGFGGLPKTGDVRGLYSSTSFYRGREKPWYRRHLPLLVFVTALILAVASLMLFLLMRYYAAAAAAGSTLTPQYACAEEYLTVELKSLGGAVRGRSTYTGAVHTFFGIPYGGDTSGDNRFRLPNNKTNIGDSQTVFHAYQHGPRCPQDMASLQNSSEDCLTLSIWAPIECNKFGSGFVVLVVLSSDWFQTGHVREYETTWEALAVSGRLIVVFIHHRLGVLGFLDAGTKDSPGNQGIEDAFLALDWISENIDAFNGDPSSLVGLGHGSGSYIASLDLYASTLRRRRFFKRLILLGLLPASLLPRGGPASLGPLAQGLQCLKDKDIDASVTCLRGVPLAKMYAETAKEAPLTFMPSCGKPPVGDCQHAFSEFPPVFLHKEILCGYDQEQGHKLLDHFVLQEMPTSKDPSTVFALLQKFFTRQEPRHTFGSLSRDTQKALNQSALQGFRDLVVDMVLRCPLLGLARAAVLRGSLVYLYASEGPNIVFEPALPKSDIISFAKTGNVSWQPFSDHSRVLVVTSSSNIVMEWGEEMCALANNLSRTIFS